MILIFFVSFSSSLIINYRQSSRAHDTELINTKLLIDKVQFFAHFEIYLTSLFNYFYFLCELMSTLSESQLKRSYQIKLITIVAIRLLSIKREISSRIQSNYFWLSEYCSVAIKKRLFWAVVDETFHLKTEYIYFSHLTYLWFFFSFLLHLWVFSF